MSRNIANFLDLYIEPPSAYFELNSTSLHIRFDHPGRWDTAKRAHESSFSWRSRKELSNLPDGINEKGNKLWQFESDKSMLHLIKFSRTQVRSCLISFKKCHSKYQPLFIFFSPKGILFS